MRLNHILEDNEIDKNDKKNNLRKKILILLLLFITLIGISFNVFKYRSQKNIDNKIVKENYAKYQSNDIVSDMRIQTFANEKHKIKRILTDIRINS